MMDTLFNEEEILKAAFAEKEREANEKGIQKGRQEGMQEGILIAIHNVMNSLNLTVEKALSVVGIPQDEWNKYIPLVK